MGSLDNGPIGRINSLNDLLGLDDQVFIREAYHALLGRAPDIEGMGYYLDLLRKGDCKLEILNQLHHSPEGRMYTVELPGLSKAIRQYRWKKNIPLVGSTDSEEVRAIRVLEKQIQHSNLLNEKRFEQLLKAVQEDRSEYRFGKIHQLLLEDKYEAKLEQIYQTLLADKNESRFTHIQQLLTDDRQRVQLGAIHQLLLEDKNENRFAQIQQLLSDDKQSERLDEIYQLLLEDKNENRFAQIQQLLSDDKQSERLEEIHKLLLEDKNEYRLARIHQLLLDDRSEDKLDQINKLLSTDKNQNYFSEIKELLLEDKNQPRFTQIHQLLLKSNTENLLAEIRKLLLNDTSEHRFAQIQQLLADNQQNTLLESVHQLLLEIKNQLNGNDAPPVVLPKLNEKGFLILDEEFDDEWYLNRYPDARETNSDPWEHFVRHGLAEGRLASSLGLSIFDPKYYLLNNPDVADSPLSPIQHFMKYGKHEGRSGSYSSFSGMETIRPEPLEYTTPLLNTKVKLIAFYLPQYHPIAENDEWWGRGFTEWANVIRATPFYEGHEQPRFPGELGFYDLRIPDVMKRQAELARTHGIFGFCFYIYWFGGKRLLESPVDMLLRHPEIDINFCYCWANENWTRRWDGLDDDILIGQSHSPEDDIEFIKNIATAFADKRYIRVAGKPMLLVYRPNLFPEIRETVNRWRLWCRNNGVGEIHVCFTTSFDEGNPLEMGMDAAIQFPPLSGKPQHINELIRVSDGRFAGQVYNYQSSVNGAAFYERPKWLEYRGVMPSWDNTPRKLERGISFYGATPELYGEWLDTVAAETCASLPDEQRFVFINAWNEWGEGAYLEPDRRRGYAYLNRTRQVMAKYSDTARINRTTRTQDIAVIVHLYYGDLFENIAGYLDNLTNSADFFFNVKEDALPGMEAIIKRRYADAVVVAYPNHGRDVLPFLHMLPHMLRLGYKAVCKIHSKKTEHRKDGDQWRDDVFNKLLGDKTAIAGCLQQIGAGAGVVAPAGHLLVAGDYWGANARRVNELAIKMGCPEQWLHDFLFPAGNMFWFAPDALKPLLSLNLTAADFEAEAGQVDGTTAHAIERLVGLAAMKSGFGIEETAGEAMSVGQEYAFAAKTPKV
ncbi:MAG: glycoside hydrolase family 99-like domain-containing protein [Methylococcales bacterium]|nr:glycoside hydrolase family 99-like domain-containing protein [Methylococcales bacterium]